MKARVHFQCAPRSKNAAYEAEDIHLDIDIDHQVEPIPQIGWEIKLTAEGDFLKVIDICFDFTTTRMEIFVTNPSGDWPLYAWKQMKGQGWKLTDI